MLIVLTSITIVMKATVSNDKGSRWEQGLKVESCLCKHVLYLLYCLLGPCDYMFKISRHTMNSFLFFIFVLRKQVSNSQMAQTTVLLAVYDKQAKMLLAIYSRWCQKEGNLQLLDSSVVESLWVRTSPLKLASWAQMAKVVLGIRSPVKVEGTGQNTSSPVFSSALLNHHQYKFLPLHLDQHSAHTWLSKAVQLF